MVQALNSIRFDIWEYFKIHCLSFRRMDCNAQFSELFQKGVSSPIEVCQSQNTKAYFLCVVIMLIAFLVSNRLV